MRILLPSLKLPKFFSSLGSSNIKRVKDIHRIWHNYSSNYDWPCGKPNPFERILVDPHTPCSVLKFIKNLKDQGETKKVIFDSGGFKLQTNKTSYDKLFSKTLEAYKKILGQIYMFF